MPIIRAKQCVAVVSSWVRYFILTCDDTLAVQFYDSRHPHHPRKSHPRPDVCCLYPDAGVSYFNLALVWNSPGRFVHHFLYRKMPYLLVPPPCPAAGCGVLVPCCPVPVSTHLTATLTGDLRGSYPLVYRPSPNVWVSDPVTFCGTSTSVIQLSCQGTVWEAVITGDVNGCQTGQTPASSVSCSPLDLVFNPMQTLFPGCCQGMNIRLEVTA